MLAKPEYDQKKKKRIVKGYLRPEEQDIILTTTQKGDSINMEILQVLGKGEEMSQSEISRSVAENGVELTHQRIREYVLELEKKGLIKNADPI
ncbi:MAG: hypothetical protein M1368_05135, partial [Thaumarchaeota archaeon]|nr:hypothetical protein [Nitrososphaerota archaeon]